MNSSSETILFYKPYEVLSQFSPEGGKKTLAHFFTNLRKDIYPVGRLDFDSEGLLLLTNDKPLHHRLLTPAFEHRKIYYAQVEGAITEAAVAQLRAGVTLNINKTPFRTRPATASIIEEPALPPRTPPIRFRKNIPTSWISLQLTEGKNRQVRRMTAAVGFPTLRLLRYAVGGISIEGMEPGSWRRLSEHEQQLLLR